MRNVIIIFIAVIGFQIHSFGNSSVEVKAELSNTVCSLNSTVVYIDLFIKKAENISGDVKLKNQNYRLSYDASTLDFTSFFINSEGLVSSYGTNSDGSFYLFAGHTLTGTTEHILSYNIDLQGGEGLDLLDDWVLVGTIGASLKTNSECFSTILLTNSDFPPTTLIYAIDGGNNIVDNDPVTYDVVDCIINYCNTCHLNLDLNTLDHNYINGEILNHQVQDYISADNQIGNNAKITFDVTNQALLKPGFEVQTNSIFEVKIDGCQ